MEDWFLINNVNTIDSPALVVYPERVKENIRLLIEMAGDVSFVRPHVKTNKIPEVCKLMLDAGIDKFKCATIAEAEMLGMVHAPDVLIAYQPVGPKAERVLALMQKYPSTHYSCLIDNFSTAQSLSNLFSSNNQKLELFIDLNTGMNRSGIAPENAWQLYKDGMDLPGIKIAGLHAYDGHIRETDLAERKKISDQGFAPVEELIRNISALTTEKIRVVVGGSPSFPTHTKRKGVEYSPGTFVFWDWGYKHQLPDEPFDYAALVITRVISVMDAQTLCVDLGHKAVAAENPLPRVYFLNAMDALPVAQSEEHLVLTVPDSSKYRVGDVLYGVPYHICPTVALYDYAVIVQNKTAVDQWQVIARTRKISV